MNILICSAGRRVKLIKYFKAELSKIGGKIVAIDCDAAAPALYYADHWELVPRINHPEYIQIIRDLCKKYQINAIISLIDPELGILARHKAEFAKENIKMIVSDKEVVDVCFDKYLTYKILQKQKVPVVPTYESMDEVVNALETNRLSFPLIVKPRTGSASIRISKVTSINELENLWSLSDDLIIQPFNEGDEYGIDCFVDLLTHETVHIFGKRKMKMRAGETDKSEAVKDPILFALIEDLLNAIPLVGPIDIDCFKTESGYVISEINPRFGGGYLHAYEAGQNFIKCLINNLQGDTNIPQIGNYQDGTIMIKYDDVMMINPVITNSMNKP